MINKKLLIGFISLVTVLTLSACAGDNEENSPDESTNTDTESGSDEGMEMEMDNSGSGEVPEDLKEAANPAYEIGSQATIQADHMEGMNDAEATIVGAYDTVAYSISYTPTTGGEKVEDHKWVIQEEIAEAGDEPLEPGTEVNIEADHMEGMDGTSATIDSVEETTVYMVDYMPSTGGEEVTNHKWVTEDELSAE